MAVAASYLVFAASYLAAQPVIPVGSDAYKMWDRWPYQRIGARAYMRSTADASHFLYQTADDFNVTLDVAGAGSSILPATITGTAALGTTRWTARITS